ncbi:hypothetical protein COCCADRAFT_96225, partial [Bipolaris zeicola 26-R-13]
EQDNIELITSGTVVKDKYESVEQNDCKHYNVWICGCTSFALVKQISLKVAMNMTTFSTKELAMTREPIKSKLEDELKPRSKLLSFYKVSESITNKIQETYLKISIFR